MTQNNDVQFSRLSGAPWFDIIKQLSFMIGGAGGIGSWTALLLARTGANIEIHDHDHVDSTNMGGQLYGNQHIGIPKVEAIRKIIHEFSGSSSVYIYRDKITNISTPYSFAIGAFDNMVARQSIFHIWKNAYFNAGFTDTFDRDRNIIKIKPILIDGRLLANQFQIFCITDESRIEEYGLKYLFTDEEAGERVACTFKQTSHVAAAIASKIVGFITNHIMNCIYEEDNLFNVPFFYEEYTDIGNVNITNPTPINTTNTINNLDSGFIPFTNSTTVSNDSNYVF